MLKKIVMTISGLVAAVCVMCVAQVEAKAALPCTYDIISNANAQIANADANYQMAKANHQAAIANYNALVACGAGQLEIEQAAFAMNNAANVEKWWLDQLNNAKAYLKNINDRALFEDEFAANRQKIYNLAIIRADKDAADGAMNIANAVATRIKEVENAIAGYQAQVAACPSLQAQIDALTVELNALKADYAVKLADANAKAAKLQNDLATLDFNYNHYFEDYQHSREDYRELGTSSNWLTELDRYYGIY